MSRDRIADLAKDLASEPRVTIDCGGVMRTDRERVILAALRELNRKGPSLAGLMRCTNCQAIVTGFRCDDGSAGGDAMTFDADGYLATCLYCPSLPGEDDAADAIADAAEDIDLERDGGGA